MIQKVWRGGTNTYVISLPNNFLKTRQVEEGDYLEIDESHIEVIKKEELENEQWKDL